MHVMSGIAKQFTNYWFNTSKNSYSLTLAEKEKINHTLRSIKVPKQVTRFCRVIEDRSHWKSREYENWILYYSIPVLSKIPRFFAYVDHWNLFVEAFYLLSQSIISKQDILRADTLLKDFVASTEELYSKSAMSYNVHQLTRLCQSVINWGPLQTHSGYPFEFYNGILVKHIHLFIQPTA